MRIGGSVGVEYDVIPGEILDIYASLIDTNEGVFSIFHEVETTTIRDAAPIFRE
jgi:hypothetical protein